MQANRYSAGLVMATAMMACLPLHANSELPAAAPSYRVLHSFTSTGPKYPISLSRGKDGNFYGLVENSGTCCYGGVFKITPEGALTLIHSFTGDANGPRTPTGRLVQGKSGIFYGVSKAGGTSNIGTVFSITPAGIVTVIHSFGSATLGMNGSAPNSVSIGTDNALYGTTYLGGLGVGTVYRLTTGGSFKLLHSFAGGLDGFYPIGAVSEGQDGSLYGTTNQGGEAGFGVLFKVSKAGSHQTLHSFHVESDDGANPAQAPLLLSNGSLFGATYLGGANNAGAQYRIDAGDAYSLTTPFNNDLVSNPSKPVGELTLGTSGGIYGVSLGGGGHNGLYGTVYRSNPSTGQVTLVHAFEGAPADGRDPKAGVVEGSKKNFYGVTRRGGAADYGTVYTFK